MSYDAEVIRRYFDGYGDLEWQRFDRRAQDMVNLHVHTHYLRRFIRPDMHVLDAGAGPGRFTIELARLGARVTVIDLSEEMLEQNRERVREAGLERQIEARHRCDIIDLGLFADGGFDAVVCFGGPLSYVMDRADDALSELLRTVASRGPLLLSVMSTLGSTRYGLPAVLDIARRLGNDRVVRVLEDGRLGRDLFRNDHVLKMYRWQELQELVSRHGCEIVAASASSFLTTGLTETRDELAPDDVAWQALLEWELRCCREPGALDGGTHILTALRKSDPPGAAAATSPA